jgi:hypothetical protein
MPLAIIIEFEDYTGPQFFNDERRKNWLPINPYSMYSKNFNCNRIQFPINLSYGLTISKSQGSTLKKVIINLGDNERVLGLAYVALTRTKNFNDMLIKPFPFERLDKIKNSKYFIMRQIEKIRLNQLALITKIKYNFLN